ncbi:unnamed protein product, partial [Sphacelaria rigidula]
MCTPRPITHPLGQLKTNTPADVFYLFLFDQDWEARVDRTTGRTYYVNHNTRQTTWTRKL